MAETARERLRRFLAKYPGATAAAAARAIGVSRQRVHQIAQDEGIKLPLRVVVYPTAEEFLGSPPKRRKRAS